MYIEPQEKKQLLGGYKIILVIWWAIFASLFIYLIVCLAIGDQLQSAGMTNVPVDMIKYALWGGSLITLFAVHYLRKLLLQTTSAGSSPSHKASLQHPATGKYAVAVIITLAMLESIGIYGVVLFLIGKDTASLYQLLIISGIAMMYYRPRKEELFDLAVRMKR